MQSIKLTTLNIEGEKHLGRFQRFIEKEESDVVCIQEITNAGVDILKKLGYTVEFTLMTLKLVDGVTKEWGIATASKLPFTSEIFYYHKTDPHPPTYDSKDVAGTIANAIQLSSIAVEGATFMIGTTHFTWTPHGERPNEAQKRDFPHMVEILKTFPPHILCGDFNIPRSENYLYDKLIRYYTDTVPKEYYSSLDKNYHKLKDNPKKQHLFTRFMVDYVFSQSPYAVSDVRLEFRISDHAAVIARIGGKISH